MGNVKHIWLLALLGCGTEPVFEPVDPLPPPEPPPSWGVPISGGTMLVTRDGNRAVIADPDRDRVMIVDVVAKRVIESIQLAAGSEPGRVIEDGDGRIHIALRGSGELLTLTDGDSQTRAICGEPRGLAWDAKADIVHIACAGGELVSVPAGSGEPVRVVHVQRDLRDVIVTKHDLIVTTFRSAEVLWIDAQGQVSSRVLPPITQRLDLPDNGGGGDLIHAEPGKLDAIPAVAWRTIALPNGDLLMSHQRKVNDVLKIRPGGYGADCGAGPVESAITVVSSQGKTFAVAPYVRGALPVDVAVDPTGARLAFAVAGNQTVQVVATSALTTPDDDECGEFGQGAQEVTAGSDLGQPTSVAFSTRGELLVFYPEQAALTIEHDIVRLSPGVDRDPGRALFHTQAGVGIACASCHPEGRDDGQVWDFEELGLRRTQSLAGGILGRAPYHWGGDMKSLPTLLEDVFTMRMSGGFLADEQLQALGPWLDGVRAPRGTVGDTQAVQRGATLFASPEVGCADCHGGNLFTNNMLVDVGTGGAFKVPSLLGVTARAPYLHDGCAATLRDRFGYCGGGELHGHTSQLTEAQRSDLIAYLDSL